jgi:hypothetical protein
MTYQGDTEKFIFVFASAVAFSHEAEGCGGKQSRMSAESQPIDHLAPMGLAMTKLISISSTIMNVLLNYLRLALILLPLATLGGCAFLQPVTETVVHAVVTQFPGSFDKLEARLRCWEHTSEVHGQKTEAERTEALNQEVDDYRALVEASLVYRAETVRLIERLRSSIEMRQPFSGEDLLELNEGLAEHLDLRKRLYQVAEAHECWLNPKGLVAEMTPTQRLKGIMISLSAALVLYDNYLFAISLYQEEPRLRLLLNNKDVGYEIDYGELNRISLSFASEEIRNRVRAAIAYYEAAIEEHRHLLAEDPHLLFLDQVITQSPSYSMTKNFSPLAYLGNKIDFYVPFTVESLVRLKDEGIHMVSMIFGNTIGLVESRRGKLHGRKDVAEALLGDLRAGDILVERTPFRLTNSFIPGYWGHAALWIGTQEELQALGIWDNPVVKPHQQDIRSGRRVVEALRSGVELNSLRHFLNVDDIVVLRHAHAGQAEKAKAILQALRQLGKRYDFNYDVQTRDRLGCAELIYHAYGRVDWPTRRELGRRAIVPDDIAVRALGGGPLTLVSLYADGERVTEDPLQVLAKLMEPIERNASE